MKVKSSSTVKSGVLDLVGRGVPAVTDDSFANFQILRNSAGLNNFHQLIFFTWIIIILLGVITKFTSQHRISPYAEFFVPKFIYSGVCSSLILKNLVLALVTSYVIRQKVKKTPPWWSNNSVIYSFLDSCKLWLLTQPFPRPFRARYKSTLHVSVVWFILYIFFRLEIRLLLYNIINNCLQSLVIFWLQLISSKCSRYRHDF